MAYAHTNPDPIADVRLYLDGVAKFLVDRLYGPAGPPLDTSLSSLEQTFSAVHIALSEQLLHLALSRQSLAFSAAAPELLCCPGCQQSTDLRPPEPRVVTTRIGQAEWSEPQYFCRKCRKAFFPSVEESRP
jgi:hypothetical protein